MTGVQKLLLSWRASRFTLVYYLATVVLLSAFSGVLISPAGVVGAASGTDFNPGRIIDDAVFYNDSSMDTAGIQSFLSSRVQNCDTNGSLPASEFGRPDLTRAQYAASVGWQAPPYICLKDYSQNTPQMAAASGLCGMLPAGTQQSAAKIINDISKACNINPQVLIVLLQKEQSLVLDTWPLASQYRNATGFACPDTAPCDPSFNGFFYQVYYAARQFQIYKSFPNSYNYIAGRNNNIYFHPDLSRCGNSTVYIENQATAGLYIYTPYQPNQAALNNLYGAGDSCSSYGNRNFWRLFVDWFGSPYGYISAGVDYSSVFDADYYLQSHPDVLAEYGNSATDAFYHFIKYGLAEGRQASANFNLTTYKNRYQDLRISFESNNVLYYLHYISNGRFENRSATGTEQITHIVKYKGIDYSSVYNFDSYIQYNQDIRQLFSNNDAGAIRHFVNYGMNEGRIAKSEFSVTSYQARYFDLRRAFGDRYQPYYLHYVGSGLVEGRTATGTFYGGITALNGIDYSAVYDYNNYLILNPDIKIAFGLNDIRALQHFRDHGMSEGRLANQDFNVDIYKSRYVDLRNVFGENLKQYYLHYISNGRFENRTGN